MITVNLSETSFRMKLGKALSKLMKSEQQLRGVSHRIEGMLDYQTVQVAPDYMLLLVDNALSEDEKETLLEAFIGAMRQMRDWHNTKYMLGELDENIYTHKPLYNISILRKLAEAKDLPAISREESFPVEALRKVPLVVCIGSSSTDERLNALVQPPRLMKKFICVLQSEEMEA